ncbi:protein rep [Bacillus cereus]|uniref:Rolling circle replication protein Rep63 protein n=1 Tax=Bacillus cereus TaxID=1396 RepID=A0A161SEE6_BACCE|nr:protein rep [Bacillus cereus]KZD71082.1 rolling circle replication protein Rep63 protein [Bacillus cereus]HDR7795977.1 protein rep [Bacillus luti]
MLSEFEQKQLDEKLRLSRAERYACQSVAKKALPNERVSKCLSMIKNGVSDVAVWEHKKTKRAFYSNLTVCGSVWNCPVCAVKISERRRKELQQAFDIHKKEGGYIALLTLTFSHKKSDKLEDILKKFGQATNRMFSGGAYQNIRDKMGLVGRIRVFECTYGANGFHPHAHIALFYQHDVDLKKIRKEMFPLWSKACESAGLVTNYRRGIDLQTGDEAQEYLSKHGTWSLDQELTKSHIKKAKYESLTPFDFLRKYYETEDKKYIYLFQEYARCFKGKRQLQWSQGLKKRFVVEDKTDEQVAKEKVEDADLLGMLEYDLWKRILKYDNRSYFLDLCEKYDFEKAVNIVSIYKFNKKKTSSSTELDSKE